MHAVHRTPCGGPGQAQTRWPRIAASSPPERWEAFCARFDLAYAISDMVGNSQRILLYPALGHHTPQEVPPGVLAAYRLLAEAGYRARLIPRAPPWPAADGPAPPPGR